jgi:hypothetical protein
MLTINVDPVLVHLVAQLLALGVLVLAIIWALWGQNARLVFRHQQ